MLHFVKIYKKTKGKPNFQTSCFLLAGLDPKKVDQIMEQIYDAIQDAVYARRDKLFIWNKTVMGEE